jgi:hypothetical protein
MHDAMSGLHPAYLDHGEMTWRLVDSAAINFLLVPNAIAPRHSAWGETFVLDKIVECSPGPRELLLLREVSHN